MASIESCPAGPSRLMGAQALLDRLDRVRPTGPSRWLAICPAHEDRSPSLSVRELDDGTTLVNCFGGCGALDVLQAVGLEWGALFPAKGNAFRAPSKSSIPARDLLELISEETTVVALLAADLLAQKSITEDSWKRLAQATARIGKARDHVR